MISAGNTVISNCAFINNSASVGGGAFVSKLSDSAVSFLNNSFINNAAQAGGGVFVLSSDLTMISAELRPELCRYLFEQDSLCEQYCHIGDGIWWSALRGKYYNSALQ